MNQLAVLVLTYNHENYIKKCLNSILEQDLPFEFPIYVVDDYSIDNTPGILKEFKAQNPSRLKIILNTYNHVSIKQAPAAKAIRDINSKYLAFCDGDDYWVDRSKLRKQLDILESNSSISLSHTDYLLGFEDSGILRTERRNLDEVSKAKSQENAFDLINGTYIKQSTVILRTSAIDLSFVYSSTSIPGLDGLFYVSAGQKGVFSFLDEATTVHRIHKTSLFNSSDRASREVLKNEFRWYCSANLPEGLLRDQFRTQVITLQIRKMISSTRSYKCIKPLVLFGRFLALSKKKLTKMI